MIVGNIEFKYKDNAYLITFDEGVTKMTIDDVYLIDLFRQNNIDIDYLDSSLFELTISAERDTLIIEEITLFEKVVIRSFNNSKASFGLLVIHDISVQITGAYIDIFRTDCNWVHVSRSLIRSFDFSFNECESHNDEGKEFICGDFLELNYVTIEKLTVYKSVKELLIKNSKIDRFEIDSTKNNSFGFINITWNTYIEEFSLAGTIDRLRIKDSIINKLNFKKTFVQQVDNTKSDINMVFMLDVDKIGNKNQSAWELLYKSAIHDENDALYANAGYELNQLRNSDQSPFRMLSGNILRATIGYGYKPYRAILFSIVSISLFALIYQYLDLLSHKELYDYSQVSQIVTHYFDMWYLSGTAYTTTGFGDIVPTNAITKVLVIFEAMVGVSVLSLFMYSLLHRYGKKQ